MRHIVRAMLALAIAALALSTLPTLAARRPQLDRAPEDPRGLQPPRPRDARSRVRERHLHP